MRGLIDGGMDREIDKYMRALRDDGGRKDEYIWMGGAVVKDTNPY